MRIKRNQERMVIAGRALQQVEAEEVADFLDRVRGDLRRRGVDDRLSDQIAAQLCDQHRLVDLSSGQYEAMIAGASLACGVGGEAESDAQANLGRVRDVERMMQAFAGELAKLDESLEVLATYVRRMRKTSAPKLTHRDHETLH